MNLALVTLDLQRVCQLSVAGTQLRAMLSQGFIADRPLIEAGPFYVWCLSEYNTRVTRSI